ncbi:TetR/AcrR family transcriptional regulator C-terminal domain-containing protein [Micromonosporaceae bacterium B7E4]
MRALAQTLGIGTASLYTYLPGKAELLELMVDRVAADQPLPAAEPGWRAGLGDLATADLAAFRARPWLLQVATSRTVFGPHVITRYDAALALLDGCGPAAIEVLPYTLQRALDRFAFGLDLVLDAIGARITAARR